MKNWIFFGIGVALGSGVTFLAVKKHYQDLAYHEISEMRSFYREKKAELDEKYAPKSDKTDATDAKTDEKSGNRHRYVSGNTEIQSVLDRYSGQNRGNYVVEPHKKVGKFGAKRDENHDISDKNEDTESADDRFYTEEDDDPYDIFVSHEAPSEGYAEQPYQISEEQFSSEKLHYDKVTVEYYADGIAVIDETDEILDSLEDQIGPYILSKPIEENEIYVRNEARSTDYYIQLKETNFVSEEGSD